MKKNQKTQVTSVMQRLVQSQSQATQPKIAQQIVQASVVGHQASQFASPKRLEVPPLNEASMMIQALKAKAKRSTKKASQKTIVALLLDESGSMNLGCKQTMDGYNQQLVTLRQNATEIGCRVIQSNFNSTANLIADDADANEVVNLNSSTYRPNGGTALYDSVAAMVKHILQRPDAHDENTSILLSINTDGDDMSSKIWTADSLVQFRELMRTISANDRWTVALAGPDTKLREFADCMSVSSDNVAAFIPESVQSRVMAMDSGVQAMGSYISARSAGLMKSEMLYACTAAGDFAKDILAKK